MSVALRDRGKLRLFALVVTLLLVAAACNGDGGGDGGGDGAGDGQLQRGGELVYGIEAETSGGFCLAEAQLAIGGIQVARAVYDTLTRPNEQGEIVPHLAESVEPNDDFTEWTITLREGVKFHDGTDLTAEVVKNNIDAYRGAYENRSPLLFLFVFGDIDTVEVVDPLTVRITTTRPWAALDSFLYGSGRIGMMAQSQLDDPDNCATDLVGTGAFRFVDWRVNDRLIVERFDGYWRAGADGEPLPYLDRVVFRPIPDGTQRVNALEGGEVDVVHASGGAEIVEFRGLAESGDFDLYETQAFTEVDYVMLNQSRAPFDSKTARLAVAHASDHSQYINVIEQGVGDPAGGPFAPGVLGHLDDPGFPQRDPDRARELVAQYEEETGSPLEVTYTTTTTPNNTQTAQLIKQEWEAVGIRVSIKQVEQAQLINEAIAGNFEAMGWRNHPGGDPDTQYIWWHSASEGDAPVANPVNFGRINDPEVDRLLDAGRVEADPEARREIYEDLNRRFAEEVHNVWQRFTVWGVASVSDVHGILGPELPEGGEPSPAIVTGHPVEGMWIEQ